jgi:hypothetical protein
MKRIIANGTTIYAENQDVYSVITANDGNDYIVEVEKNEKIWNLYMPLDESEDELECFEGPILALPSSKIDLKQHDEEQHQQSPIKLIAPKKKSNYIKPTTSPKFTDVLNKEAYFDTASTTMKTWPVKKKVVKKLLK